ncbi:MAG: hypothetical protein Q4G33_10140 [bacterium]|nr:hypothetical protein [bacterium]
MDKVQVSVIETTSDISDFINQLESVCTGINNSNLHAIMRRMTLPVSVVIEPYYVDKLHRDTYYSYYAGKHFDYNRNCHRLAFFRGDIPLNYFHEDDKHNVLDNAFIGIIVLRPLFLRPIGRTLLDPCKLNDVNAYIRTTTFSTEILGNMLEIDAFPFLSQDVEVMTCAETTIWNILEYYGNRYPEYRTILPCDIIGKLESLSYERVLPSDGLDYFKVANLLKTFSFAPKLYAGNVYSYDILKRLFHYYVESGIPLAVGVQGNDKNGNVIRHSIVCIGHSSDRLLLKDVSIQHANSVPFIDSSQLYNKYVIVDDNQMPYTIEEFSNLTIYDNTSVSVFVAPLYKRIFLDADDAHTLVYEILAKLNMWDFINRYTPGLSDENPIVIRLFLTSSRKYKSYKVHNAEPNNLRNIYMEINFPKFLWVAEISTYDMYTKGKALGEIIIDATSTRVDVSCSIISIRYKNLFGYRNPNNSIDSIMHNINTYDNMDIPYNMYYNNLKEI